MTAPPTLTPERLHELLHYAPETGVFTWRFMKSLRRARGKEAGCLKTNGYVYIHIDDKHHLAHRLAFLYMTGKWPTKGVDHKDCNKSNNRWDNLREAGHSLNAANVRGWSTNKSGFRGVRFVRRDQKWRAAIVVRGQRMELGIFPTPEAASEAYQKAAVKHFGEFARRDLK